MTALITVLLLLMAMVGSACASSPPAQPTAVAPASGTADASLGSLRLQPVFGGWEFDAPTNLVQARSGELLITE